MNQLNLESKTLDQLVTNAKQYCIRQNLVFDIDGNPSPIPVTLFPSPIKRSLFYDGYRYQGWLNSLLVNMSVDYEFMERILRPVIKVDSFCRKLFDIYERLYGNTGGTDRNHSRYSMGLFRTDYFVNRGEQLKQIEINAISVSFFGLAPGIGKFHSYTLDHCRHLQPGFNSNQTTEIPKLPDVNQSLESIGEALAQAHRLYSQDLATTNSGSSRQLAILVLVEDRIINLMDQMLVQWQIESEMRGNEGGGGVLIVRESFRSLNGRLSLSPENHLLLQFEKDRVLEISVIYYRTGYVELDYDDEIGAWDTRLLIERSKAVKAPSVAIQLAGMKTFQLYYSDPETFDRYVPGCTDSQSIRDTFARFYPIDEETCTRLENGSIRCVLKSNLEGGGHNIFGDEIVPKIREILNRGTQYAEGYSLMEYIEQNSTPSYIVNAKSSMLKSESDSPQKQQQMATPAGFVGPIDINSELGIYGSILYDHQSGGELFNESAGHLLRSKPANSNEVGINAGHGFLDSPLLTF